MFREHTDVTFITKKKKKSWIIALGGNKLKKTGFVCRP